MILYAPTWRENQHLPGEGYQFQLPVDFKRWREVLGDEYVILFRAHYFISNSFDFVAFSGFVYDVSQMDDINPLYLAADVLITDYSSIYIDYLLLERPMLFLPYDREDYLKTRGFNFDYDEVTPGPKPKSYAEFLNSIEGLLYNEMNYVENRKKIERKFNKIQEPCSEYICRMVKE